MEDIVIVSAARTAVGKFGGSLAKVAAPELGSIAIREAIARAGLSMDQIGEVIMGQVLAAGAGQNPARQAMMKAGVAKETPALTINAVCGSGLKAVMLAAQAVAWGDSEIVIAGGQENMSASPHVLNGSRDGLTINLGYSHGGGALNIVPDRAVLKFNVRTSIPEDECWLEEQLDLLLTRANDRDGFKVSRFGGFTRPPKIVSAGTARLQSLLNDCGREQGLTLQFRPTGGCCDGNNLAAAGLANVDNLGVVGGDIHSDREWMRWSSLAERARLSAALLLSLASGARSWA